MQDRLDTLIVGGTIVTMDGDFRVIADGAVGIRGGRLALVGDAATARDLPVTRRIDATGKIVMPGLIDAHAHAGHGLTKGLLEGHGGGRWMPLMEQIYHRASTPAFWYAEGLLSAAERLRFGVTTGLSLPGSLPRIDDLRYVGASIRAHEEVGIRYVAAVGPPVGPWPRTFAHWEDGRATEQVLSLDAALERTEEAVATFHGRADGRVRVYPTPSNITMDPNGRLGDAPLPESVTVGRAIRRIADRYRVPIHTHAFGGMIKQVARAYPELLGPDISIAHCTGIDDEEVRILGEARASVAHGPLTHAFVHAWCPVIELLDAGANVVITTDASSPDRSFDLLGQVHPAMHLQRVHYRDSSVLPAGKALAMVTIEAARALGMADEVGSLEVGKQADVAILDARQPQFHPFADLLAPHRLAYMATGADVETVIVGGRVLMEDRRILTIDLGAALDAAGREAWAALERAGATDTLALPSTFWTGTRYGQERAD